MTMLNEHLEHEINQQLLADEDLSSQRIIVTANNGEVTLMGSVQSFRRKLVAQEIAESSEHVTKVNNRIEVASPEVASDISVAEQVDRLLEEEANLTSESIRVTSKDLSVALTGYVNTEHEKARAADITASVDGVAEVTNFLVANPDQVLANRQHCQTIQASISGEIGMEREDIRLSVVNETARLSGQVDAPWKREIAEEVTRQHGILHVMNDVVVRTAEDPTV